MAKQDGGNKQGGKKRGFQVGPRLAKGAYTGHAQRIKRTLIHKAKVKKAFAKTLKQEGYEPPHAGGSASRGGKGIARPRPDAGEPVEDEAEKEAERERLRRRLYGDDEASDDNEQSDDESDDEAGRGKSARFQNARRGSASEDDGGAESASPSPSPEPEPAPRIRDPLPSQSASHASSGAPKRGRQKLPPASEKKAAAPPPKPKRPKLTEQEIEQLREKRRQEKRAGGQRNSRGQAKLGGRMEHLLGKIRRTMES